MEVRDQAGKHLSLQARRFLLLWIRNPLPCLSSLNWSPQRLAPGLAQSIRGWGYQLMIQALICSLSLIYEGLLRKRFGWRCRTANGFKGLLAINGERSLTELLASVTVCGIKSDLAGNRWTCRTNTPTSVRLGYTCAP